MNDVPIFISWFSLLVFIHLIITWSLALRKGTRSRKEKHENLTRLLPNSPVSIIIPAWNEHRTITACIQSLEKITYPIWEAVIIAGGDDGTYEEAIKASKDNVNIKVLERGPVPKNVAILHGIDIAQYNILILLDADSTVSSFWLTELIASLNDGASASIGHRFPKRISWISTVEQMEDISTFEVNGLTPFYGDCSMAIRRETLLRVGGLPSGAYSREDWELEERLRNAGERIVFADKAILFTDRPSSLEQIYQYTVRIHRARIDAILEKKKDWIHNLSWIIGKSYFFILGIFLLISLIIVLISFFFFSAIWKDILLINSLFFTWLCGRRIALNIEVFTYTRNINWLTKIPAYILIFYVKCVSAIIVLFSRQKQEAIYQGPREASMKEVE